MTEDKYLLPMAKNDEILKTYKKTGLENIWQYNDLKP